MIAKGHVFWLLAVAAAGCVGEPEASRAVSVSIAPAAADKEVLVASNPSGATIVLKGAPVGETPMKLLVRDETNLILEKEGYVRQALLITPSSDPNLVVDLEPLAEPIAANEPDEAAVEDEQATGKTKTTAKKKAGEPSGKTAAEPEPAPEVVAAPEPEPAPEPKAPAATPPASKGKTYTTMRQIKDDLAKGIITKDEYRKWQSEIRKKRAIDLEAAEKDLRSGKITKNEYNQKVREIKLKYEG